jgi:hypothetical protein
MNNTFVILGIVVAVIALIIAGPLLIIWAINTLFPIAAIEYNMYTWLAALILGSVFGPTVRVKKG